MYTSINPKQINFNQLQTLVVVTENTTTMFLTSDLHTIFHYKFISQVVYNTYVVVVLNI